MMSDYDPAAFHEQSRKTWNGAAARYEKMSSALFGPLAEELVTFADIRKGWRVLDIACGPGLAARAAARRAGEKGGVLATDFASEMITLAAERPAERRAAPIEWRTMDAQALDLPAKTFDAVICSLGLMLFTKPDQALAEMRRVAAPGSPVACLVQGRRSHMLFTALVFDAIISRAPQLRTPKGAPTLFAFGPDRILEEAFARANLEEIVTRRLNGHFRFKTAEDYWETMTSGSGRARAMLDSLDPFIAAKVKADVLRRATKRHKGSFLEIPYEFVMASGRAPSRR